jgi:hypothetical protein
MSDPGSVGPEKTAAAKKPISPARRMVSLIVLAGVIVFGCIEVIPKWGYNSAVAKLETRTGDEDKGLMTMQEAEALMGKDADGPAADFRQENWSFSTKTYTWKGLLWHYTLTAYYTKEKEPHLHHYETEGQKVELARLHDAITSPDGKKGSGGTAKKGGTGKAGGKAAAAPPPSNAAPDSKSPSPAPSDKPAEPKSEPSDKAGAPAKPSDSAPKDNPTPPSDKPASSKPATDPPAAKPSQ